MKVAITQPNFLPWLGYFDLLDEVDLWVSLDNVQHVRRSYIPRNRVRTPQGQISWLTVTLQNAPQTALINEVQLHLSPWWEDHLRKIEEYYRHASAFAAEFPFVQDLLPPRPDETRLSAYNRRIILELCAYLGISVESRVASEMIPVLEGTPEAKILSLCDAIQPTQFYNFQTGVDVGLYHAESFRAQGMTLFKQEYEHPSYLQTGGEFVPYLSVVDLLLNVGRCAALEVIRRGKRWIAVT